MKRWPEEVIEWLQENVPGKSLKEITQLANEQGFDQKYGMTFDTASIKNAKNRYKIKSGTIGGMKKGSSLKYPEGMEEYIKSIAWGRPTAEIAHMTAEHFGISFSEQQCAAYKKNHHIRNGRDCRFKKGRKYEPHPMSKETYEKIKKTMFRPGNVPTNYMKIGEYTHTTAGYLIQKVKNKGDQRKRFVFVHRKVWEEHNGPIPEGKKIGFLDGNKDNCDISNLFMVDNETNLEMNRSKLRSDIPEATETGIKLAELNIAIRKKKQERREHGRDKR